jgi:hypothetical protein
MADKKEVVIKLTEEQQNQIKSATGKEISELKVGAVEDRANPFGDPEEPMARANPFDTEAVMERANPFDTETVLERANPFGGDGENPPEIG